MNRKRIPLKHIGELPEEKQHEIILLLEGIRPIASETELTGLAPASLAASTC